MTQCDNKHCCKEDRLILFSGHARDCFFAEASAIEQGCSYQGYVLGDLGLGPGGDTVEGTICLHCGKMQGEFPLPVPVRLLSRCHYCEGSCPHDEDNACDGYQGDIDNLYKKEG